MNIIEKNLQKKLMPTSLQEDTEISTSDLAAGREIGRKEDKEEENKLNS